MQSAEKPIGVMLVDDHPTLLWGLTRLIDGERPRMHVVGTARSCEEALDKSRRLAPDMIVLDLDLAGKNALDILPALVANSPSQVLVFTGSYEQALIDHAVLRGARGVLRKDAPGDEILKALETIHRGEIWLDRETAARVLIQFIEPKKTQGIDPEAEKQASLTAKERKIIGKVVEGNGAPNKALAESLFITEHTLRNHLTSIYQKLGVRNRLELYVYAVKHSLGKPGPG